MAMPALHISVGATLYIALSKFIPGWCIYPIIVLSHIPLDLYPEYYPLKMNTKKEGLLITFQGLFVTVLMALMVLKLGVGFSILIFLSALLFDIIEACNRVFSDDSFFFFHGNGKFPIGKDIVWQSSKLQPIHNLGLDFFLILVMVLTWL